MYMKETTGNTDHAKAKAESRIGCLVDPGARKRRRQRKEADGATIKIHGSIHLTLRATSGHKLASEPARLRHHILPWMAHVFINDITRSTR